MLAAVLAVAVAAANAAVGIAPPRCRLSNVFGDHMVLQRQPGAAMVWGFAAAGTTVTTCLRGSCRASVASAGGVWRQVLPPSPAPAGQGISFACSTGERFALADVLFGDVHVCGGQSNMQFTLAQIGQQDGYDAAGEIAKADGYPRIRTMTVGQTTASYAPLDELKVRRPFHFLPPSVHPPPPPSPIPLARPSVPSLVPNTPPHEPFAPCRRTPLPSCLPSLPIPDPPCPPWPSLALPDPPWRQTHRHRRTSR